MPFKFDVKSTDKYSGFARFTKTHPSDLCCALERFTMQKTVREILNNEVTRKLGTE